MNFGTRSRAHATNPVFGGLELEPINRTSCYPTMRGLQQLQMNNHSPSLNRIRGISPTNPNAAEYLGLGRGYLDFWER